MSAHDKVGQQRLASVAEALEVCEARLEGYELLQLPRLAKPTLAL